jgi:hypothetical protein
VYSTISLISFLKGLKKVCLSHSKSAGAGALVRVKAPEHLVGAAQNNNCSFFSTIVFWSHVDHLAQCGGLHLSFLASISVSDH